MTHCGRERPASVAADLSALLGCRRPRRGDGSARHIQMAALSRPVDFSAVLGYRLSWFRSSRRCVGRDRGRPPSRPVAWRGDVPDPAMAPAMCGVAVSAGSIQNVELTRLFTMEEIANIRQKARQIRGAYKPPGQQ